MCGISALIGQKSDIDESTLAELKKVSFNLKHRGPDCSGQVLLSWKDHSVILNHERLSIVDPKGGAQPITSKDNKIAVTVNGEIYNHMELKATLLKDCEFKTGSDCEVILHLYKMFKDNLIELPRVLDGPFAFVLVDSNDGTVVVARDPIGVNPLYIGVTESADRFYFASEMKAFPDSCAHFRTFSPGCIMTWQLGTPSAFWKRINYYTPQFLHGGYVPWVPAKLSVIRDTLTRAVQKRLMSDVPFGLLLSGGLDSSLIASIAMREFKKQRGDENAQLDSFTIGFRNFENDKRCDLISPDIINARNVAEFLGTRHHEYDFTFAEAIYYLPLVINLLETYDVTTIRAGLPLFILADRIRTQHRGLKMVLSGEGADEILGGYLYFHKAPNALEFFKETVDKLENLQFFDLLRANKALAGSSIEVRVPFLDKDFLDVVMNIRAEDKMITPETRGIEKFILRKAFDVTEQPYLPESVLWRQKEQFSDGVGYEWIDQLKDHAEKTVSDEEFNSQRSKWQYNMPQTKEAYLYRKEFEKFYPSESAARTLPPDISSTVACSTKRAVKWAAEFECNQDPSGRSVLGVHQESSFHQPQETISTTSVVQRVMGTIFH